MSQSKPRISVLSIQKSEALKSSIKRGVVTLTTDCAVFDVTATGAKLLLHGPMNFPETFQLAIDAEPARTCRVTWRKGSEFGVEFIEATGAKDQVYDVRRTKREKLFGKGMIVYNDAFCTMDCDVVDYSAEGARLKPLNPRDCPAHFQLRIKQGPTHNCKVVRRSGAEIGVRFLPT